MALADIIEKFSEIEDPAEVNDRIEEIWELLSEMRDYLEDLEDPDLQDSVDEYFERFEDQEDILEDPAVFLDETNELLAELKEAGILNE